MDLVARDADCAGVRLVHAGEHVHQRGLARAVLAEDGVNLARPEVERDVVVGENRSEALGDAAHLDERRRERRPLLDGCVLCHWTALGLIV